MFTVIKQGSIVTMQMSATLVQEVFRFKLIICKSRELLCKRRV